MEESATVIAARQWYSPGISLGSKGWMFFPNSSASASSAVLILEATLAFSLERALTSPMEMPGILVISIRDSRKVARKGTVARASFSMGILVSPDATNRLMPMGGVTIPMARLQVMMIPKWMGSTPKAVATGTIMGVRIMMLGMLSMNIPQISMMMFMISSTTYLLSEIASTAVLIVWGYRSRVMTLAKAAAAAITKRMFT